MSGLFYNLGKRIGRAAIPAMRKTRWLYDGLAGTDEQALHAEWQLGRALAAELRESTPPAPDASLQDLIQEIASRLAPAEETGRKFRVEVLHDPSPNAVSLPGGYIFMNDALAEFCERRPGELAFVIAHEMAHIILRHAWDRVVNDAMLRVATTVSGRAGILGAVLRKSGFGLLQSAHSRKQELEADALGLKCLLAAGFSPSGAITALQRMASLDSKAEGAGQYFASHPPAPERIACLEELLRQKPVQPDGPDDSSADARADRPEKG